MHISKIELENIKSHAASTFEFTRGTTAITGENGAGKTTIIEAIAWVLFDLLDYKKEDFVKRGEKKGVVRVTFESGLDEREYIVTRDTGAGYNVTDPRLQAHRRQKRRSLSFSMAAPRTRTRHRSQISIQTSHRRSPRHVHRHFLRRGDRA